MRKQKRVEHAGTLTDRRDRHNLEVTEQAFGFDEGRAAAEFAMRFDLVDLQLFIAVADARSITPGRRASHLALASASARIKGLEAALGVALLKRGRRGVELTAAGESLLDHARIVIHNVDAMRGDLAAFASGVRASVHLLANTSGLSEHLPKALAAFLREHPDINVDIEERESTDIARRSRPAPPISALPPSTRCLTVSSGFLFSEDRLTLVASRRRRSRRPPPDRFCRGDRLRFRRPDRIDRAADPHLEARRPARRAPEISGAAARFRRDLPDGRGRRRHCRGAGSPRPGVARDRCRSRWSGSAMPGPTAGSRSAPAASRRCRGRPSYWWSICARRWRDASRRSPTGWGA